ncbi:hypothetical protein CSQ89_15560 [Chitinimonas sp. BJB300]|nr:hypothetical protein CSQ89_15560 [Chitinimonas sp. BJB300]TSJ87088.1 recombinase family protein [Chitinimonas sp. BJB300]
MQIGYARVSTEDQHLDNQRAVLLAAGCQRIYKEKISGAKRDRPELTRLLEHLRAGDVVVATRLDRLARSTRDLLELAEILQRANVGLRSVAEPWADTTSPSGKMVLTVFGGIAEFERALIVERTRGCRHKMPIQIAMQRIWAAARKESYSWRNRLRCPGRWGSSKSQCESEMSWRRCAGEVIDSSVIAEF